MTAIFVFDTAMIQIFEWITQNLFQKSGILTAKFNCLQAIYFYAPSALAVPMCGLEVHVDQVELYRPKRKIKMKHTY